MTISLLALAALACSFVSGLIVGAYGHKCLASKAASLGVTPPTKLP